MKIEKATILVFVAVTFICGLLTNANATLLVNGSFEDGTEPSDVIALPEGSTEIDGWVVLGDGIDYVGTCWVASEGDRSLDLDPSAGFGGIKQTFDTDVGQKYLVTFDMAGNPYRELGDPPIKYMGVSAAGQSADFAFDTTGKSFPSNMGWVTHEWEFTANDTSTTLELFSLDTFEDGYSGYCGPALDNVSVSMFVAHTPEPATLSLLGVGSLVWLRRRRT